MGRYLFIDGRHLQKYFAEQMKDFFGEAPPIDFVALLQDAQAEKLFFYDSVDYQAPAEKIELAEAELDRIQETPGCHVREGTVRASTKRRKREQKQVDVLLAVEMLTHGFRRNFDDAVLVTSDLDFKPVVDSLIALGSRVAVWYIRGHQAEELLASADVRRELTLIDFFRWSGEEFIEKNRGVLPRIVETDARRYEDAIVRRGLVGKRACTLFGVGNPPKWRLVVSEISRRKDLWIEGHDQAQVEKLTSMVYGQVAWNT